MERSLSVTTTSSGSTTGDIKMLSGTLGVELIRKRPGGLRVELSALNATRSKMAYRMQVMGLSEGLKVSLMKSD